MGTLVVIFFIGVWVWAILKTIYDKGEDNHNHKL